jgi:hypothetical protein
MSAYLVRAWAVKERLLEVSAGSVREALTLACAGEGSLIEEVDHGQIGESSSGHSEEVDEFLVAYRPHLAKRPVEDITSLDEEDLEDYETECFEEQAAELINWAVFLCSRKIVSVEVISELGWLPTPDPPLALADRLYYLYERGYLEPALAWRSSFVAAVTLGLIDEEAWEKGTAPIRRGFLGELLDDSEELNEARRRARVLGIAPPTDDAPADSKPKESIDVNAMAEELGLVPDDDGDEEVWD